jgi:hypothetical protein
MKRGLGRSTALIFLLLKWCGTSTIARAQAAEGREVAAEAREEGRHIDPRIPVHAAGPLFRGWARSPARWFFAARADLGFLFFSPRAEFGYGLPHEHWAGADIVPLLSTTNAGAYAGLRYRHPRFEFRTGGLFSYALGSSYLEPSDSFDARDLELEGSTKADYGASDSELSFSIPWGRAYIGSETQALFVFAVPDDKYVFVHSVGAVIDPPWVFRERLSVSYPFPGVPGLFVAPACEAVFVPERPDPWVFRAGALLSLSMYQDVDVTTEVLPTIKSPDTLGRAGAPWLEVALRVRFATGR